MPGGGLQVARGFAFEVGRFEIPGDVRPAGAQCLDGQWQVVETQPPIDWQGKGFLDPVRLESYIRQCQDFIDACIDNRPPAVTGWDGRQAVATALAASPAIFWPARCWTKAG